ncbi:MAG: hypothetical protein LBI78_07685 [Campylobacteraceae bacterium]|nr:hypothetical protein [Campylobacteraceae bacterium]
MRFLLINTNPAVSKLINASLNRIGHEVTEADNYNSLSLDTYIAIIIDSDSYKAEYVDDLLAVSLAPSLIYLKGQDGKTPENFQYILRKPFLPTDFLAFIVSILTKTLELNRFVTAECKQFENIPLPQGASTNSAVNLEETPKNEIESLHVEQENDLTNYRESQDNLENKNPAFDIKESLDEQPYVEISGDIFSNFSEELQKLYDDDESEFAEQNANLSVKDDDSWTKEKVLEQTNQASFQDLNMNNSNFVQEDNKDLTLDRDTLVIKDIDVKQEDLAIDNTDKKIDFDFSIFDKPQENIDLQKVDLTLEKQDESILEDKKESDTDVKLDFGFGDLAKEFDDLITGDNNNDDFLKQSNENDTKAETQKFEHPKYEFENLSEKDMQKALQDSGMLPPSKDIEVVKTEIGQVVEQSVKSMLQGQILRDVLKGLKMNITITFEDKD